MAATTVPLIIDGQDVVDSPETVFTANPGGFGARAWRAQGATKAHSLQAVESASRAWKSWRETTPDHRANLFSALAEVGSR